MDLCIWIELIGGTAVGARAINIAISDPVDGQNIEQNCWRELKSYRSAIHDLTIAIAKHET